MKQAVDTTEDNSATQETLVYVKNGPNHGVFGVLLKDEAGWYFEPQQLRTPERVYYQLWKAAEEGALRWRTWAVMGLLLAAICLGALVSTGFAHPDMIKP